MEKEKFKEKTNSLAVGLIVGIIMPLIAFLIYYLILFNYLGLIEFVGLVFKKKVTSAVFYVSMLPDFFLFFLGIWRGYERFARGILAITLISVLITVILHFT